MEMKLKIWLQQIRAPFLILSVILVLIGAALAYQDGYQNLFQITLLLIGVVAAHISANLFNEYSDYHTKIDEHTKRTPFSGGSGMLQANKTTPKQIKAVAYFFLSIAFSVGVYFTYKSGWPILIFMGLGLFAIRCYTSYLSMWLLGEVFSGLALGTAVIVGTYYALTANIYLNIIFLAIPPGILTFLLLLLNEIPDAEADEKGGRFHPVILLGKRNSIFLYAAGLVLTYLFIAISATIKSDFATTIPHYQLLAFCTMPIALMTVIFALLYVDKPKFQLAQGLNTALILGTDLLLGAGYLWNALLFHVHYIYL